MTLHLVKLCVGADSIAHLARWQDGRLRLAGRLEHTTFQTPKRQAELLDGGSLYWVIKGVIEVRQLITGFESGFKEDGSPCCLLLLDPTLVPVRPVPRGAFQGWRYLNADDAPADIGALRTADALGAMPAQMRKDLAGLGLL